jgi:hypothetical protein
VQFIANSRPAEGVSYERLTGFFDANGVSSEAWELVRNGIVTDYAFKVGDSPGVVLFLHGDSEDEARKLVDSLPIVTQGLVTFEVEPLGTVMHL